MLEPMSPAFINGKTGTILNVFTRESYRRKGYARKIMDVLLGEAKDMGLVTISGFVENSSLPLGFLPVLIFVIAALMSFSMGTSWGTFGMLIPIVTMYSGITDYRTSNEIFIKHYFAPYFSDLFPCLFRGQPI